MISNNTGIQAFPSISLGLTHISVCQDKKVALYYAWSSTGNLLTDCYPGCATNANGCGCARGKCCLHCGAQNSRASGERGPHQTCCASCPDCPERQIPGLLSFPLQGLTHGLDFYLSSPSPLARCPNLYIYTHQSRHSLHEFPKTHSYTSPHVSTTASSPNLSPPNKQYKFFKRISTHLPVSSQHKRYHSTTSDDYQPQPFPNYHHFSRYSGNIISNGANE